MTASVNATQVNLICPHCKVTFQKKVDIPKKQGLFNILINNHHNDADCPPFIVFIDTNGMHRGSQKIDDFDDSDFNRQDQQEILDQAHRIISQLEKELRFYHLKMPRKNGRGFEHKVSNVMDRTFMDFNFYKCLIDYLQKIEENNTFGSITHDGFKGGILVYGKYLGMIYTIYWIDQKSIQDKTFDELKGLANLTIEKLIEIYDLMDFFF